MGLFEVLSKAQEIKEINDPSPLVVIALHRLLLANLHRNFGPESLTAWNDLWQGGHWDERTLTNYFNRWRHRFDLFHPERPFYLDSKPHSIVNRHAQYHSSGCSSGGQPIHSVLILESMDSAKVGYSAMPPDLHG